MFDRYGPIERIDMKTGRSLSFRIWAPCLCACPPSRARSTLSHLPGLVSQARLQAGGAGYPSPLAYLVLHLSFYLLYLGPAYRPHSLCPLVNLFTVAWSQLWTSLQGQLHGVNRVWPRETYLHD